MLECQFRKKLNIKSRKFQLILQMIAMEINLTITMTHLQLETRIYYALQIPFETHFLTVIGNAKLRPSFVICWVAQGSWPRCGPRHPILHSNIFTYIKLFATIILSWNSLKCILWYWLELSDPFIKNENSVLPILIEKNFEQRIHFCLLKMKSIFFLKKGNLIFSIKLGQRLPKSFFQLHVKNSFFFSYFVKKDNWPKAYADPRLPTLPYPKSYVFPLSHFPNFLSTTFLLGSFSFPVQRFFSIQYNSSNYPVILSS